LDKASVKCLVELPDDRSSPRTAHLNQPLLTQNDCGATKRHHETNATPTALYHTLGYGTLVLEGHDQSCSPGGRPVIRTIGSKRKLTDLRPRIIKS